MLAVARSGRVFSPILASCRLLRRFSTQRIATQLTAPMSFAANQDFIAFDFLDGSSRAASSAGEGTPEPPIEIATEPIDSEPIASTSAFKIKDASSATVLSKEARGSKEKGRGVKRKHAELLQEEIAHDGAFAGLQKQRLTPWMHMMTIPRPENETPMEFLGDEIKSFIFYASTLPYEQDVRRLNVKWIRKVVKEQWRDDRVEIEMFGSGKTGTEVPGGDIDLVLALPSSAKDVKGTLITLAQAIYKSGISKERPVVIHKARVPIVKFVTKHGSYKVDISLNQMSGITAAKKVVEFLDAYRGGGQIVLRPKFNDPDWNDETHAGLVDLGVARSLILLVKMFLAQRGMNEVFTGGLSSYAIICMVVSFLQLHPMIQSGQILPVNNIGVLFIEFLELYGKHFNYDDCGISVLGSGGYYSKVMRGWWQEKRPMLLSIEDPNDTSNDISSGSYNIIRVRQTFAGAYDVLCATIYQLESEKAAERNPRVQALEGQDIPKGASDGTQHLQSILGSIFGLSNQLIRQRKNNLELWKSGFLQRKVGESNRPLKSRSVSPKPTSKPISIKGKNLKSESNASKPVKSNGDQNANLESKQNARSPSSSLVIRHLSVSDSEAEGQPNPRVRSPSPSRYDISHMTKRAMSSSSKFVMANDSESDTDSSLIITLVQSQAGDEKKLKENVKKAAMAKSEQVLQRVIDLTEERKQADANTDSGTEKKKSIKAKEKRAKDKAKRNAYWTSKGEKRSTSEKESAEKEIKVSNKSADVITID